MSWRQGFGAAAASSVNLSDRGGPWIALTFNPAPRPARLDREQAFELRWLKPHQSWILPSLAPLTMGVDARRGLGFGPCEVRNMSSLVRQVHHVTRINPNEHGRIADIGATWSRPIPSAALRLFRQARES